MIPKESECICPVLVDRVDTSATIAAAAGVLAKGEHRINTGGEAVQVEPWYEQFHRPLLLELLARREHKAKPAVPPRPKQMSPKHHTPSQGEASVPPPGYVTSGGPPSAPQHPASDAAGPALEELLAEMEKLRLENEELKSTEAKKAPSETLKQQVSENEKRKSEKEKLKLSTVKLSVPDYQLRLLKDFADQWKGCQVTMMEQQQEVLFYGAQEDCVEGKRQFLRRLQVCLLLLLLGEGRGAAGACDRLKKSKKKSCFCATPLPPSPNMDFVFFSFFSALPLLLLYLCLLF